jgi:enoyl-CoA hydratase
MSDDGRIVTRLEGAVMTIGIDRPAKLNGFTPEMLQGLGEAYAALEREDAARVGLLYAEGRHFTAGLDLPKMAPRMREGLLWSGPGLIDPLNNQPPFRTKPLVVAVQGICFTIGIELMLAADIVIAARDCRFSQLEVKRGLMATGGATIRMVERAGWGNAMRYLLTGDEFDAETAWRLGFVQEVVEPGRERGVARELAERIAAQAPLSVRATIENARTAMREGEAAAVAAFAPTQKRLLESEDAAEGLRSFVEKRPARFTGR